VFSINRKKYDTGEHAHEQGVLNLLLFGKKIWYLHGP
jgi:hypothetical protein